MNQRDLKIIMRKMCGERRGHSGWGCPCCSGRFNFYGPHNDRPVARRIARRVMRAEVRKITEE